MCSMETSAKAKEQVESSWTNYVWVDALINYISCIKKTTRQTLIRNCISYIYWFDFWHGLTHQICLWAKKISEVSVCLLHIFITFYREVIRKFCCVLLTVCLMRYSTFLADFIKNKCGYFACLDVCPSCVLFKMMHF